MKKEIGIRIDTAAKVPKFAEVAAEIHHVERWISVTDPTVLKSTLGGFLRHSGFDIVAFTEHFFPVQGYTCVWLLAESHFAVHTFPSDQKTFIQLSSCNKNKAATFEKLLAALV